MVSNKDDAANSNSTTSDDESGTHEGQVTGDEEQSATSSFHIYSSHISAVCDAMNAARKRSSPKTSGMTKQEKRREANRLSARKCRKRRKDELEEAEDQIRRLSVESSELSQANKVLRSELHEEVVKALRDNTSNVHGAAATLQAIASTVSSDPALIALLQQPNQQRLCNSNGGYSKHLQVEDQRASLLLSSATPGSPVYGLLTSSNSTHPTSLPYLGFDNVGTPPVLCMGHALNSSSAPPALDMGHALNSNAAAFLQARQVLDQLNQAHAQPQGSWPVQPMNLWGRLPSTANQYGNIVTSVQAHSSVPLCAAGYLHWFPNASFPCQRSGVVGQQAMVGAASSSSTNRRHEI